jgi:hypothetical protein
VGNVQEGKILRPASERKPAGTPAKHTATTGKNKVIYLTNFQKIIRKKRVTLGVIKSSRQRERGKGNWKWKLKD